MLSGAVCVTSFIPKAELPLLCFVHVVLRAEGNPSACSSAFQLSGAPQAQGTAKILSPGPGKAVVCILTGDWRIKESANIPFSWEFGPRCYILCLSLSVFLLGTRVKWPLGKIGGTGKQEMPCWPSAW